MKLSKCNHCGKKTMVNSATWQQEYLGEFCADCFDIIFHDRPHRNTSGGHSGHFHNDPSFDNVIRALEEDR